ncbi:MAG: hypothetical protein ACYT04_25350, partial [Nostoc sp.]
MCLTADDIMAIANFKRSLYLFLLTSSPPYFVEGGDSKDRSLGFLFPRVDLLEGVSSPLVL